MEKSCVMSSSNAWCERANCRYVLAKILDPAGNKRLKIAKRLPKFPAECRNLRHEIGLLWKLNFKYDDTGFMQKHAPGRLVKGNSGVRRIYSERNPSDWYKASFCPSPLEVNSSPSVCRTIFSLCQQDPSLTVTDNTVKHFIFANLMKKPVWQFWILFSRLK